MKPEPYLTIPEAIAVLRISRATFYRLVRAGTLKTVHISPGRVLVARTEIDRLFANKKSSSGK
jgi:excisionase family DNA binding protein